VCSSDLTKIADLEQNIKNIEKEINSFENKESIIPKIAELLNRYDELTIKEKNEMLKTVLLKVEYLKTKNIPFRNEYSNAMWVFRFVINVSKEIHKSILSDFNTNNNF
jgi:hypothetical protein